MNAAQNSSTIPGANSGVSNGTPNAGAPGASAMPSAVTAPAPAKRRGSAGRKVIGALVALLLVVAAAWCFLLMYSMNLYDKATAQLVADIETFTQDDSADLDTLLAQQQAVDSQFEAVQQFQWAHVPALRSKVDTNTQVSRDLTDAIRKQQEENANSSNSQSNSNNSDNSNSSGSGESSSSDNSDSGSSDSPSSSSSSGSGESSSSSEAGATPSDSSSSSSGSGSSSDASQSQGSSGSDSSNSDDGTDSDQQKLQELLNRNGGSTVSPSATSSAGGSTRGGASRPW
ncbi:MAG: DUF6466 family protein [Bifidobacteriaceae bacterium]|nr:DUF6466 family protein [Bifidobacteriaceae bacterium]